MCNPFCRPKSIHRSFTATIVPDESRMAALTGSAVSAFNDSMTRFMIQDQG
jgi:hypothetical protein